jgi:hypothetical protein
MSERITNKMLQVQVMSIRQATGRNLQIDNVPIYGGCVLVEIGAEGQETQISNNRRSPQEFYSYLRGMTTMLDLLRGAS